MTVYTFINVKQNEKIFYEKLFKLLFLLVIVFFGGIIHILN